MTVPSPIVGRSEYLQWIQAWIENDDRRFQIIMLHGPAGIGKSTLLEAIRHTAEGTQFAVWMTNAAYLSTPMAWIDYMGFLMRHHSPKTAPDVLPATSDRIDVLNHCAHTLRTQPTIMLIDNAESLGMTGEWLRTQFLPPLREAPVLLVMAARNPLMEWVTSAFWQHHVVKWPLPALSYEETRHYLMARHLDPDEWGAELFHRTHGHPLTLALAVDHMAQRPAALPILSQTVTAHVLREVVREDWIPYLEALALVQEADQTTLEAIAERPLGSLDYHQLLALSFVKAAPQGLRMHDTIRQLFIDDLRHRDPVRFQDLRRRALRVLSEWRSADDAAMRLRTGAILLELYREDLPVGSWLTFSAVNQWCLDNRVTPADRALLHRLLPDEPRTQLLRSGAQHELLDALLDCHPAGVRVIRSPRHEPLGFWAGLWLSERTMPILDAYFPTLATALADEAARYRHAPEALADTCVTVFFCYRDAEPLYTVQQVRGLVLYDALIVLGGSVRVISTSEYPPFRQVMQSMGLRPQRLAAPGHEPVEVLVGDKRGKNFLAFLWWLDRLAGPQPIVTGFLWRAADIEALLEVLNDHEAFHRYVVGRQFPGHGAQVRHRLLEILTRYPPPAPLTTLEQDLLRDTYLSPDSVSTAIADRLHVSRSTYYRYRKIAIHKTALLMNQPAHTPAPPSIGPQYPT